MGFVGKDVEDDNVESREQPWVLNLHPFSDLSYVSPVVFLFLLKECYVYGKYKTAKRPIPLQLAANVALLNSPQPGPAVFTVHCLYALPLFEPCVDGLGHLILSALRKVLIGYTNYADLLEAQDLAAQLFMDVVQGFVLHDNLLVKIMDVLEVHLIHFERAKNLSTDEAGLFIKQYIFQHIEFQSYMTAVSLLKQFGYHLPGDFLLKKMIEDNDFKAAEKWASYMRSKAMLCVIVEEYVKLNMLVGAYGIITRNYLQQEFPHVCHKYKESTLKDRAERGFWSNAEWMAKNHRQLIEYLVFLAMEAGFYEKVEELCDRYSLEGFVRAKEAEIFVHKSRFLHLHELFVGEVVWIDGTNSLQTACSYLERCKVVGLDCEWASMHIKGDPPGKVSILQIASEKVIFIFDMVKLYDDVPEVLNNCLARIIQSPSILKLGYEFQSDLYQLSSYQKLDCFNRYQMLLNIHQVFRVHRGGLSGLVKKILGAELDKTVRDTNWTQRPLTKEQLEYAAMDAVVLIHLFYNIGDHSTSSKIGWKSHIVSRIGDIKKSWKKHLLSLKKD